MKARFLFSLFWRMENSKKNKPAAIVAQSHRLEKSSNMKRFCSGGGGGVSIPQALSSALRPAALNSMNIINLLHPLWIKRHTFVYLHIQEDFRSLRFWVFFFLKRFSCGRLFFC